jgi:hypothetical protein
VNLMGPPNGIYIYPLINSNEGEGMVYVYNETRGFKAARKFLVISVDKANVVTDVEFASSNP